MPILKYHRMKAHVETVCGPNGVSQVTALCLHPRCLIVGTSIGHLHLIDYQGSGQELGRIPAHKSQRIRCISIDDSGEFVASCSDAGTVHVVSLTFPSASSTASGSGSGGGAVAAAGGTSASPSTTGGKKGSNPPTTTASSTTTITSGGVVVGAEQTFRVSLQPLYAVHLDPAYRRKTEKAFVAGGQAGQLVLARKGFFTTYREDVLHENEGPVTAIAWRGSLLAWANEEGVKVLDVDNDERISFVERPEVEGRVADLRCSLLWESDTSLLIGWFDTFIVLQIKPRGDGPGASPGVGVVARGASPGAPTLRVGEITVRWKADCVISGLSPFDVDSVAVLGYVSLVEGDDDDDEGGPEEERRQDEAVLLKRPSPPPPLADQKKVVCRAELQLRTRLDGHIFSAEILPLHGEERVRDSTGFLLASSFALTCKKVPGRGLWRLPRGVTTGNGLGGGRAEAGGGDQEYLDTGESFMPVMLIAAPEDIMVARVRNVDDRILWVLKKGAFGAAIELALLNRHLLTQQRFHALATSYLEQLLAREDYARAAAECPRLLGVEATLWERWIYNFASRGKLAALAPFIPLQNPRLSQTTYEMVLYHFLDNDPQAFFDTLRRWGTQQHKFSHSSMSNGVRRGDLYDLGEVTKRVAGMATVAPDPVLLQAQAYLHQLQGRFEAALAVYWELFRLVGNAEATDEGRRTELFAPVFRLIEEHNLFDAAQGRVLTLVRMDRELAGDLLVRYVDRLPVESVVKQLQQEQEGPVATASAKAGRQRRASSAATAVAAASASDASSSLLLWYLHLLFRRLPDQYNDPAYKDFHVLQVELYAKAAPPFAPVKEGDEDGPYASDLLSFLMWSNHVRLETTLAACERRSPPLYDEMVYILGRIGHTKEALTILLEKIGSVTRAIDFVERHDKALWRDLTAHSLQNPVFLAGLLRHAGEYNVDLARSLLQDIPDTMQIKGLKHKLLGIIASYHFERTLHECCRRVAESDWVGGTRRFHHAQRRAVRVDVPVALCQGCHTPLVGPPPSTAPAGVPARAAGSMDGRQLHVFSCRHAYHDVCCLAQERQQARLKFSCVQCRDQSQHDLTVGGGGGGGMKKASPASALGRSGSGGGGRR